jgi:hypothetical protein
MHFFRFTVGDEAGMSMAAGNRSAIPSDRYSEPLPPFAPGRALEIIAAIEQ